MRRKIHYRLASAIGAVICIAVAIAVSYGSLRVPHFRIHPNAPPGDVAGVAAGENEFAMNLYGQMAKRPGNLFFSPYSISSALAMTYAGAHGRTAAQMAHVLHISLPNDRLHAAFGTLLDNLNAGGSAGFFKTAYELNVANGLWCQKGYSYNPTFLQLLERDYGVDLQLADFISGAEQARSDINQWVSRETNDKIEDLLPPGVLNPTPQTVTRLVLVNAIYFKGNWDEQFEKTRTSRQPFHLDSLRDINTEMMGRTGNLPAMQDADLQAVEMSYIGNDLSVVVLLPKTVDGLSNLEAKFDATRLQAWLGKLREQRVDVTFPKFKMDSQFDLADVLASMGMPDAFSRWTANFSGITTDETIFISHVIHKAYVDVNEEGTEAAAATGVGMTMCCCISSPVTSMVFRADHPFIFLLRQKSSGAILFMGRVTAPKR